MVSTPGRGLAHHLRRQEKRVRMSSIAPARRRYAAAVNSACQGGDLDALQAALALQAELALTRGLLVDVARGQHVAVADARRAAHRAGLGR